MFFRLRHGAVVGGDDEDRVVIPLTPANMLRTKRSCPGTSMNPLTEPLPRSV